MAVRTATASLTVVRPQLGPSARKGCDVSSDLQVGGADATEAATAGTLIDALVVGAGFGGIYMLHALRSHGYNAQAVETGTNVGGTWYWNRYPGARCDVESIDYSYAFSEDLYRSWEWSERYATQPEILRYADYVTDELGLRDHIRFSTTIVGARFDEAANVWTSECADGQVIRSRFLIGAVGCLSASQIPQLPGIAEYDGPIYHTGRWPHEGVDLTGRRVAVIGTGSSGIQLIPQVARDVDHLTVFQRTPNFSFPARNRPLTGRETWHAKEAFPAIAAYAHTSHAGHYIESTGKAATEATDEERVAEFEHRWQVGGTGLVSAYTDLLRDADSNAYLADFIRAKIAELVDDPEVARTLMPFDHAVGAKRPCVDTDYYSTYNRDNVELVDLRQEPIAAITKTGIATSKREFEFDALIFATGFDAMTGPLTRMGLTDTSGVPLGERWADGPAAYLGLTVSGFPNLFTLTGPGSPSVLVNVIRAIEQHVEWVVDCLDYMKANGHHRIEAEPASDQQWAELVDQLSAGTPHRVANSWWNGANIEGKARVFMIYLGGLAHYRERCDQVAADGYTGFVFDQPR
jgi:cation diffusion facilitator CzcD-associated flavoprotein CzcO